MQTNDNINWHDQWKDHAHGFKDGKAHICFKDLGIKHEGQILLEPGPGFGDLSHPTTWLVLSMMYPHVAGKNVLDVGCGSGILSVAAAHFGAKSVFGIDIEDDAIIHARKNSALNNFSSLCTFAKSPLHGADILLMNMIRSEQLTAYNSLPSVCKQFKSAFTSGILKEDLAKYLKQTAEWGWKCIDERHKKGWMGFQFEL